MVTNDIFFLEATLDVWAIQTYVLRIADVVGRDEYRCLGTS